MWFTYINLCIVKIEIWLEKVKKSVINRSHRKMFALLDL